MQAAREARKAEGLRGQDDGQGLAVEGRQEDGGAKAAEAVVPVLRKAVLCRARTPLLGSHEYASGILLIECKMEVIRVIN